MIETNNNISSIDFATHAGDVIAVADDEVAARHLLEKVGAVLAAGKGRGGRFDSLVAEHLSGGVDGKLAGKVVRELLTLEQDDPEATVNIVLNSPGGSVTAGLAIYDTMQFIKPDVATLCVGQAASMGAFLLAGGAAGKRACLPNSRVMIHQPLGGYQGQATDIEIHTREILKIRHTLNSILAHHTGQDLETIAKDTDRDNFMDPAQAKEYGLGQRIEGGLPEDARCLVVEDAMTSGGSTMKAITAVRAHGATVAAVLTLVDREEGAGAVMEAEGIPVFALFTGGELLEAAQESA